MNSSEAAERVADAMLKRSRVHGVAPAGDGTRIQLFVDDDLTFRERASLKREAAREAKPFAVDVVGVPPAAPHSGTH